MMKTTAKVKYRRFEFLENHCYVDFYGFRATEMEDKWAHIKNEQYDKYDSIFTQNKTQIKDWRNAASDIRDQVKMSKSFYRFWYNKTEKDLLATADKLSKQADELEEENEEVDRKRFFDACKCSCEIEYLLQQNGFVLTQSSESDSIETEVWTREE